MTKTTLIACALGLMAISATANAQSPCGGATYGCVTSMQGIDQPSVAGRRACFFVWIDHVRYSVPSTYDFNGVFQNPAADSTQSQLWFAFLQGQPLASYWSAGTACGFTALGGYEMGTD